MAIGDTVTITLDSTKPEKEQISVDKDPADLKLGSQLRWTITGDWQEKQRLEIWFNRKNKPYDPPTAVKIRGPLADRPSNGKYKIDYMSNPQDFDTGIAEIYPYPATEEDWKYTIKWLGGGGKPPDLDPQVRVRK